MAVQSDVEYFARLVDALEPWLDQVVIIGGWAHRLYRLHPLAQPLEYQPLGTFDTDIAVPLDLPGTGGQIRARLLERNFREELMGDMQPPAAHYRVETGDSSFYAEFLTPLEGSAVKRGGQARRNGPCLRSLSPEPPLPRTVTPKSLGGNDRTGRWLSDAGRAAHSYSNPASFLVQKIYVSSTRQERRRQMRGRRHLRLLWNNMGSR